MKAVLGWIAGTAITLMLLIGLVFLFVFGLGACANWNRGQKLKDAHNEVKITAIQIQNQEQRVKIAKQHAAIRFQNAIGVREAQDEIAKTLTPLYVQFEMVEALKAIAASGSNNSVVYIPSGANGIPLVSTLPGPVGVAGGK